MALIPGNGGKLPPPSRYLAPFIPATTTVSRDLGYGVASHGRGDAMDQTITTTLARSGSKGSLPSLVIVRDAAGKVIKPRDGVQAQGHEGQVELTLRPVRDLFTGDRRAPDLSRGPTPELEPFFMLLEYTVVRFCDADGRDETDQEMEQVYTLLRRRPDGGGGMLFAYLRAAARMYMSVRDVSAAEYEAVMRRLTKSARSFSMPPLSRNYLATLRPTFAAMTSP